MKGDIDRDDRCARVVTDIYTRMPEKIDTGEILAALADAYYAGYLNGTSSSHYVQLSKPKFGDDR